MRDKKGFTLIELLAVIAILGIIMLLVYPNVAKMFTNGKKEAFKVQIRSLVKSAETRRQSDVMGGSVLSSVYCHFDNICPSSIGLSADDSDLQYVVLFDANNKIIGVGAQNSDYCYINTTNVGDVDSDDFIVGGKAHLIGVTADELTFSCGETVATTFFHTNYVYWNTLNASANTHYGSNTYPANAKVWETFLETVDPGVMCRTKMSSSNQAEYQEICVVSPNYSDDSICFGSWIIDDSLNSIKEWFDSRKMTTSCSISGSDITCNINGATCKIEQGNIGYCTDSSGERCSISLNGEAWCTK